MPAGSNPVISRLYHPIGTSSEPVTAKLYEQKVNEIAMLNETPEILPKCQWRLNVTRTSRCEMQIHCHIFLDYQSPRVASLDALSNFFESRTIWRTARSESHRPEEDSLSRFLSLWWSRSWMLRIKDNWRTQREMNVYCKQDAQISRCRWPCRARLVIPPCQWAKRRSRFERTSQSTNNRSVCWRCQNTCDQKQCEYPIARCTGYDSEEKTHVILRHAISNHVDSVQIIISGIWSMVLVLNRPLTMQYCSSESLNRANQTNKPRRRRRMQ